jgi:hypothetical protein
VDRTIAHWSAPFIAINLDSDSDGIWPDQIVGEMTHRYAGKYDLVEAVKTTQDDIALCRRQAGRIDDFSLDGPTPSPA